MLWTKLKSRMIKYQNQIISEGDINITYKKMIVLAEYFAKKISGKKCCGILCRSELNAAIAVMACIAAGVTAVPLSYRYGENHCKKILEAVSPDALILDDKNDDLTVQNIENSEYKAPSNPPVLIMCTSGTTGNPKCIMLSKENIISNLKDVARYFKINKRDKILISRPLYHCAVLTDEFLISLIKGVQIRFLSENFNPMKILNTIRENRITTFCATPTILNMLALLTNNTANLGLKNIVVSGECMGKYVGEGIARIFPQCKIYHVYGLTEACPRVSYLPPKQFKRNCDCVGKPLKSLKIKITDESGNPVKKDKVGMLWVKGGSVMQGYYNDCKLTEKTLRDGWLRTGDMAKIQKNGYLKIMGRSDDLIIRAGMNIYPREIENALKSDARTREVLAYEYRENGVKIGLKISGEFQDVNDVRRLCKTVLPEYQMPSKIVLLEELPKNATGKVLRGVQND